MDAKGLEMARAEKNPCEALVGDLGYAEPQTWSEICSHDAAPWYNQSRHAGKTLVVSSSALDGEYAPFLETTIAPVSFEPPGMPSMDEKKRLVKDEKFLRLKPEDWDKFPRNMGEAIVKGLAKMHGTEPEDFEELFCTWTAVHSNFSNPRHRSGADFMNAPYAISDSAHISSCCVELFNLLDSDEKAFLVRPCIGSVIVKALLKDQYYLVRLES